MEKIDLLSKAKTLHLVSTRLLEGLLSGNYRSVFRGPGIEFDEVREYTDSDDARNIDWNVSARMNSPYTKTYREEREIILVLIIDVSASMMTGSTNMSKADSSNMIAALLAYAAVHNGDRVCALLFSDKIEKWVPSSKRHTHASRLVRDLVTLVPRGRGSDLALAVRTVLETVKRRGICVVVSDFRTNVGLHELTLLSRKHDVIAAKITDPTDLNFPATGLIEIEDPETGASIAARPAARSFQRDYREFWQIENSIWEKNLRKRGIDILNVSTTDDPSERLLSFFNARKGK